MSYLYIDELKHWYDCHFRKVDADTTKLIHHLGELEYFYRANKENSSFQILRTLQEISGAECGIKFLLKNDSYALFDSVDGNSLTSVMVTPLPLVDFNPSKTLPLSDIVSFSLELGQYVAIFVDIT